MLVPTSLGIEIRSEHARIAIDKQRHVLRIYFCHVLWKATSMWESQTSNGNGDKFT